MQNFTLSLLVRDLNTNTFCDRLNPSEITSKLWHHVFPLNPDLHLDDNGQFPHKDYFVSLIYLTLKQHSATSHVISLLC